MSREEGTRKLQPLRKSNTKVSSTSDASSPLSPRPALHSKYVESFNFSDNDSDDVSSQFPQIGIDISAFDNPNFVADKYLASQRHLGLDTLKSELNAHVTKLKAELVALINKDYTDFVHLSTSLKGVDRDFEVLRVPLQEAHDNVASVKEEIEQNIDFLQAKLEQRNDIKDTKASLHLMIQISDSISKVEELLMINSEDGDISAQMQDVERRAGIRQRVDRVAIEFNQMQYLTRKGQHFPFVEAQRWRVDRITDTLDAYLRLTLKSALAELNQPTRSSTEARNGREVLLQCLRIFASIDKTADATYIIRTEFVRPSIEPIIAQFKGTDSATGTDDTTTYRPNSISGSLTILYSKFLAFLNGACMPLLEITSRDLKNTNYHLLADAIWVEIKEQMIKELTAIFASGNPDIFHSNYSSTMDFFRSLESFCRSEQELAYLRGHAAYQEFISRWQLAVYFQLRFKQISNIVEEDAMKHNQDLQAINNSSDGTRGEEPFYKATSLSIEAIKQCWSDDIFLYALCGKFWLLTLQLLQRYKHWIADEIKQTSEELQRLEKAWAATATSPRVPRSDPFNNSSTMFDAEAQERVLCRFAALTYDVELLTKQASLQAHEYLFAPVRSLYYSTILPKIPETMQEDSMLEESMTHSLTHITSDNLPECHRRIVAVLTQRCVEQLKLVRGITSQYRHTNRPAPTQPSVFVHQILLPFKSFTSKVNGLLKDERTRDWASSVAEAVTTRYLNIIQDLLLNLRKSEDWSKRLKKAKSSSQASKNASSDQSLSDEDKIRLQIKLDVDSFGQELSSLDINADTFSPYHTLKNTVEQLTQSSG
ncbi:hypothetical protein BZG36_00121 [Bifiguratus adelaidae]|uniref:Conserved oligomeric Golgi complex subunit 2 n=1 Tax=Bifiguratus adelaidae TaxID=1938954 RepID=A0A261Y849_9FUNG|nr:hypothetical protein BZG36_00121 [Bifiguratus adelaidae]